MAKAILILGIYLSNNNDLCEKLISLVQTIFDDNLIVIALIFFVSFTFSIMKNIVVFPARSRLPVKLFFFCIAFGSVSSACCLLKSTAIRLLYICLSNKHN